MTVEDNEAENMKEKQEVEDERVICESLLGHSNTKGCLMHQCSLCNYVLIAIPFTCTNGACRCPPSVS